MTILNNIDTSILKFVVSKEHYMIEKTFKHLLFMALILSSVGTIAMDIPEPENFDDLDKRETKETKKREREDFQEDQTKRPSQEKRLHSDDIQKQLDDAIKENDFFNIKRLIHLGAKVLDEHFDINNENMFIFLLHYYDVNSFIDYGKGTPLNVACIAGNIKLVILLLSLNADINLPSGDGWLFEDTNFSMTPLIAAVYSGHLFICELLLKNGANVHTVTPNNLNALTVALAINKMEIYELLLKYGAKNISNDKEVLYYALIDSFYRYNNSKNEEIEPEGFKTLLKLGADIDFENDYNYSLLRNAVYDGTLNQCKLLLSYGANVESIYEGRSALEVAGTQDDSIGLKKIKILITHCHLTMPDTTQTQKKASEKLVLVNLWALKHSFPQLYERKELRYKILKMNKDISQDISRCPSGLHRFQYDGVDSISFAVFMPPSVVRYLFTKGIFDKNKTLKYLKEYHIKKIANVMDQSLEFLNDYHDEEQELSTIESLRILLNPDISEVTKRYGDKIEKVLRARLGL